MPTSSVAQFKYQPERLKAGSVYYYTKSNLDGSNPARIYIRVRDEMNLDVWKFESHNSDAAYVTAHMDWDTFSADQLQSWVVTPDRNRRAQAKLTSSFGDESFSINWRDQSETIQVGHYPVHVYNFDFISLNFILRHWTEPQNDVEIGIIQPNFDPSVPGVIKYEGVVTLKYLDDEERNDFTCRKYLIGGEGLQSQNGTAWLHRDLMHVVDMEIPVPDNPSWNSFKFNLVSMQEMDEQSWIQFLDRELHKLNSTDG